MAKLESILKSLAAVGVATVLGYSTAVNADGKYKGQDEEEADAGYEDLTGLQPSDLDIDSPDAGYVVHRDGGKRVVTSADGGSRTIYVSDAGSRTQSSTPDAGTVNKGKGKADAGTVVPQIIPEPSNPLQEAFDEVERNPGAYDDAGSDDTGLADGGLVDYGNGNRRDRVSPVSRPDAGDLSDSLRRGFGGTTRPPVGFDDSIPDAGYTNSKPSDGEQDFPLEAGSRLPVDSSVDAGYQSNPDAGSNVTVIYQDKQCVTKADCDKGQICKVPKGKKVGVCVDKKTKQVIKVPIVQKPSTSNSGAGNQHDSADAGSIDLDLDLDSPDAGYTTSVADAGVNRQSYVDGGESVDAGSARPNVSVSRRPGQDSADAGNLESRLDGGSVASASDRLVVTKKCESGWACENDKPVYTNDKCEKDVSLSSVMYERHCKKDTSDAGTVDGGKPGVSVQRLQSNTDGGYPPAFGFSESRDAGTLDGSTGSKPKPRVEVKRMKVGEECVRDSDCEQGLTCFGPGPDRGYCAKPKDSADAGESSVDAGTHNPCKEYASVPPQDIGYAPCRKRASDAGTENPDGGTLFGANNLDNADAGNDSGSDNPDAGVSFGASNADAGTDDGLEGVYKNSPSVDAQLGVNLRTLDHNYAISGTTVAIPGTGLEAYIIPTMAVGDGKDARAGLVVLYTRDSFDSPTVDGVRTDDTNLNQSIRAGGFVSLAPLAANGSSLLRSVYTLGAQFIGESQDSVILGHRVVGRNYGLQAQGQIRMPNLIISGENLNLGIDARGDFALRSVYNESSEFSELDVGPHTNAHARAGAVVGLFNFVEVNGGYEFRSLENFEQGVPNSNSHNLFLGANIPNLFGFRVGLEGIAPLSNQGQFGGRLVAGYGPVSLRGECYANTQSTAFGEDVKTGTVNTCGLGIQVARDVDTALLDLILKGIYRK